MNLEIEKLERYANTIGLVPGVAPYMADEANCIKECSVEDGQKVMKALFAQYTKTLTKSQQESPEYTVYAIVLNRMFDRMLSGFITPATYSMALWFAQEY